jgi:PilZ domain
MEQPVIDSRVDRRQSRRVQFVEGLLPPATRIWPGREVTLVDLSGGGALLEGIWRLRPGARLELQMRHEGELTSLSARVHRCYVASIAHGLTIRYRAAVMFEHAIDVLDPMAVEGGYLVPVFFARRRQTG